MDSDKLYTPPASEDEQEYEHFPNFKNGETIKFQLGMVFNNKDLIWDAIKEYAMDSKKNVFLKKNDEKRMVVKCLNDCKFYTRFNKRVGNQY